MNKNIGFLKSVKEFLLQLRLFFVCYSVLKPIRSLERLDVVTPTNKDKVSTKKGAAEINILDCVDVLDNLYGSEWRKKADAILQSTEPRKQPVARIDRAVQTEK